MSIINYQFSIINCRFTIALVLLITASAPAQSQLDSLVATALRNNPEIKMARYESMAAKSRISPAAQLPDPQLKVAAMNIPSDFNLTADGMTMFPQLTIMQMFPWFGKLSAAGDVKRFGFDASKDRLANTALDVVANIKKVYGEIYQTQKTISYLEYKKSLLNGVVKVSEQLFAVGQVPQQDVFRATAELTMVQSDLINMNGMLKQQYAELAALIGSSEPKAIEVDTLVLPQLQPLPTLETQLMDQNPYLSQVSNLKEAAKAQATFARKDAVPDVSAGVSYGYRGALMPNGAKVPNMMNFEVGLSLPIFYGAKQQKMIDEADFMKRAADQEYSSAELSLQSQLRSMYADAEAQYQLVPLYTKELIPQYEATYNSSLSAYSVGRTTFAMLIDNLTTLINTKIELAKIESGYFSATAEISKLVGENSRKYRGVE